MKELFTPQQKVLIDMAKKTRLEYNNTPWWRFLKRHRLDQEVKFEIECMIKLK